ncbi:energy-coupling factor transporter transmembrane component T family protein [Nonomuraea dietziae]|uniref:energy-coupling factor transporter transmembrane component T family protein n=1 Tax=Nonomuraea dietziae TaxID=65515 RepID=UPI0033F3AE52
MIGVYVPGDSLLHRLPAWAKVLGLVVSCTVLVLLGSLTALAGFIAYVAIMYLVSGVGFAAAWAQIRPLRWFAPVLFVMQFVLVGLDAAVTSTLRIVLAVALAGLVTLTTRFADMMTFFERCFGPLRRVGVDPFRVSLLLSLTVRSVPVISALATRVREAQRARGVSWSMRAFAIPLVVSALRHADALGEALSARGLDD